MFEMTKEKRNIIIIIAGVVVVIATVLIVMLFVRKHAQRYDTSFSEDSSVSIFSIVGTYKDDDTVLVLNENTYSMTFNFSDIPPALEEYGEDNITGTYKEFVGGEGTGYDLKNMPHKLIGRITVQEDSGRGGESYWYITEDGDIFKTLGLYEKQ